MSSETQQLEQLDDLSALGGEEQEPQIRRPAFCPPHVNIGDIVYWYPAAKRSNRPCPMMVTNVEGNVLSGTIFYPKTVPRPRIGIRHVDDPSLAQNPISAAQDGAWDRKG